MSGPNNYVKRWRTALHVTVSALMVAIFGLAITPVAHAAAATATLAVEHTWQTGFIARFTIVNASLAPLTDWKLEFDLPAGESVVHTWNSTITQSGTHYVLTPANWNRRIVCSTGNIAAPNRPDGHIAASQLYSIHAAPGLRQRPLFRSLCRPSRPAFFAEIPPDSRGVDTPCVPAF
jgi:hypothetical protein